MPSSAPTVKTGTSLKDLSNEAIWAPNAKVALDPPDRDARRFDVMFSEVVMSGMNEPKLGRKIRCRWPNLPVILTSGYSQVLANVGAQDPGLCTTLLG